MFVPLKHPREAEERCGILDVIVEVLDGSAVTPTYLVVVQPSFLMRPTLPPHPMGTVRRSPKQWCRL